MLKFPFVAAEAEYHDHPHDRVVGAGKLAIAITLKVAGVLKMELAGEQLATLFDIVPMMKPVDVANPEHITVAVQCRSAIVA